MNGYTFIKNLMLIGNIMMDNENTREKGYNHLKEALNLGWEYINQTSKESRNE